jgi:dTDP-4-dehydrorhamnose 3,5-epimerase-like enzyme
MKIERVSVSFRDERGEITDILKKWTCEYVTLIHSRRDAVRGNHYHKDTFQYAYVLNGRLRIVSQMPDGPVEEAILEAGCLVLNVPMERHALQALDDTTFFVFTRGPRGGDDYEADTFRLDVPLIKR